MFPNLETEMARKRITKGDISKLLGVRYATVIDKTKGRTKFTIDEALQIKTQFFPDCNIEYLFSVIS